MTEKFIDTLLGIVKGVQVRLTGRIEMLEERCAELESSLALERERMKAIEDRPVGVVYRGVWQAGIDYKHGDVTTWDGSMWIVTGAGSTRHRPGDSRDWTLAVKKGKDGRNAREDA